MDGGVVQRLGWGFADGEAGVDEEVELGEGLELNRCNACMRIELKSQSQQLLHTSNHHPSHSWTIHPLITQLKHIRQRIQRQRKIRLQRAISPLYRKTSVVRRPQLIIYRLQTRQNQVIHIFKTRHLAYIQKLLTRCCGLSESH